MISNSILNALFRLAGPASFAETTDQVTQPPVQLLSHRMDPFGYPRPVPGQKDVPLRTSLYFEVGMGKMVKDDTVIQDSISATLIGPGGRETAMVKDGKFVAEFTGRMTPSKGPRSGDGIGVYIELPSALEPLSDYTVRVAARSQNGAQMLEGQDSWSFTTEPAAGVESLSLSLDLAAEPVHWRGGFFTGFCKPSFCTSPGTLELGYEVMRESRRRQPKAWNLQRDFWLTGSDNHPGDRRPILPNIVRERETRRITRIEERGEKSVLHVEDFFGHEQYGIESNRPLSGDYHPGDEVLVADGYADARAKIVSVDDAARTVTLTRLESPSDGWKIDYFAPLPEKEDPNAPGLFPPGGCYLRKFNPVGTPHYWWGRVDREWDLAHRVFGHTLMPNFVDAPGDTSVNGRNWSPPKDWVQLHEVTYAITAHLIERYGDACLKFSWSIFNEPDLGSLFWHGSHDDLQRFYDYSVDAILRAFEDRGYDSDRVFIGGYELAGVGGATNLWKLREFLTHCSPRGGEMEGVIPFNAAFADSRLDGKRSRRVDRLCKESGGKGTPCDFISVHTYNRASRAAAKLLLAKEIALEIDPETYSGLWINNNESCPDWMPPPDPAAADCYFGNGYYPGWIAQFMRLHLQRAAEDPRYSFGESILTFWPWPNGAAGRTNACVQFVQVDDDGDGKADRTVAIPMPINSFIECTVGMGPDFWVVPETICGGHTISGFASRVGDAVHVLLYDHAEEDAQSRSGRQFEIALSLQNAMASNASLKKVKVTQYQFDRENNTYFSMAQEISRRPMPQVLTPEEVEKLKSLSELRAARSDTVATDGKALDVKVPIMANGANFLVIEPA